MREAHLRTDPEVERRYWDGLRALPEWRKIQLVSEMIRCAWDLVLADEASLHPESDEKELRLRAASRFIDRALLKRAYGWDPEEGGTG